MKRFHIYIMAGIAACLITSGARGQEVSGNGQTEWKAEAFVSTASGKFTPFWMTSNRYGLVPLEAGNGYMLASVSHAQKLNSDWNWKAGVSLAGVEPRYRNFLLQELYAGISYKRMQLTLGSHQNYTSLWDKELSSGDMVHSTNARPIPELNLSMPEFTVVPFTKGWLQVKGDFALGRSMDSRYLEQNIKKGSTYINNVLWHHKSGFMRISDSEHGFPLEATVGVQHWAQWGGTSTNPKIGKQPQSLKDFIKVMAGQSGDKDATLSDQINVLGNHFGSYDMSLAWNGKGWRLMGYHQLYFEDKSGTELATGTDGLWGLELNVTRFSWIKKVVLEHAVTRNQGGQFHFIVPDHNVWPSRGGGGDDYYNNGEYTTGASYFNRGVGSPLIPSPEYNEDGSLGFKNNRISDWHLGISGDLSNLVSYRLLGTTMTTYGTHSRPLREIKRGLCGLLDISYHHPKLEGWLFTGAIAGDTQNLFGRSLGVSLQITKTGLLKSW